MKPLLAVFVMLLMIVALGSGMLMAFQGKYWMLISSVSLFWILFAVYGCRRPEH